MGKRRLAVAVLLLATVWGAFFVHACAAGPAFDDPGSVGDIERAPRVQVGLGKFLRAERAEFRVHGPYALRVDGEIVDRGESLEAAVSWDRGLRINERVYKAPAVLVLCSWDGSLEVGGARYPGDLVVVADEDRQTRAPRVTLVNDVDLEDYLKGVVGKEMSLSADPEALKAQVIAARTYAVYESRHRTLRQRGENFDLYDDERSQMYGGLQAESALARRLVDETRGLFSIWNGRLFKTFYSSTCGGATDSAKQILGGEAEDIPPLGGTTCGFCEGSKHYRWSEAFERAELEKKLFPGRDRVRIRSIRVSKTLPGGHALEVAIALDGTAREVLLHANGQFRRKIDPRRIRSTLWERIEEQGEKVVITGRGWGHGAGMCQTGAYKMAAVGRSAREILEHYYPQSRVEKLY